MNHQQLNRRDVSFGEVCSLRAETANPLEINCRYVGLEHIDSGNPKLSKWGESAEVSSLKSKFYPGDILYGKLRPYLDKAVLAEFNGICSTDILVFKAGAPVVPEFLINLIHSQRFLSHAVSSSKGVHHPRTSWYSLASFRFPLFPLPEQQAIAMALRAVQGAREARRREVALERERKAALMDYLFTHGTRGEPRKQTEIGEIPQSWRVERLGDVYNFTKKPKDLKINAFSYVPFVPMEFLSNKRVFFDKFLLKTNDEITSGTYFEPGDILLAKITPSFENGKQGIIDRLPISFGIATSEVIPIKEIKGISHNLFLFYYLLRPSVRSDLAGKMEGSTGRQRLGKSTIENLTIPIPSLPEQIRVMEVLYACDTKIGALEQEAALLEELFRAMLEELMSGRLSALPLA